MNIVVQTGEATVEKVEKPLFSQDLLFAERLIRNSCFSHSCFPDRYQPELLRLSKDLEMLEINGSEEEKMTINSTVGDNQNALKEKFTCRSLFLPSEDIPTPVSGRIVYISTMVVGKDYWGEGEIGRPC